MILHCFYGAYRKDGERIFFRGCSNATRADGFKLKEGRLILDIRKKFFAQRTGRPWHSCPDASSLQALRSRLDGALGSLNWWEAALPMARG